MIKVEYYDTIHEMPLHNWEQLNITNDLNWIVKKNKFNLKVDGQKLADLRLELHDQHADLSGNDSFREDLMVLMVKRIDCRMRMARGDRSAKNFLNMYDGMIQNKLSASEDGDIIKSRLLIQKAYGMPINPKEITVAEYIKISDIVKDLAASQGKTQENGED